MAKKFFYVCAGLLMLALTYHLGAQSAGAQAASLRVLGSDQFGMPIVQSGGSVYQLKYSPSPGWHDITSYLPVSASSIATMTMYADPSRGAGIGGCLVTETGDGWTTNGLQWTHVGALPGATSARTESFGALKAKYR